MAEETPILPPAPESKPRGESDTSDALLESLRQELEGKGITPEPVFRLPWRTIALVLGGVVLIALTFFLIITFFFSGKATLEIKVEPAEVSLRVDDGRSSLVQKETSLKLVAGQHQLLFEKEGYINESREVELRKGETSSLVVVLRPISSIKESIANVKVRFASVARDGKSFSFFDPASGSFNKWLIGENKVVPLFDQRFSRVEEVVWSPDGGAAIAKIKGRASLPNMVDNSNLLGAYMQIGERPSLPPALFGDFTNFLFDNERRNAAGFQPVKLSDGIRGVSFSPAGDQIAYFYKGATGERSIIIANRDGGEWRRIITEGLQGFDNPSLLFSPDAQYLLFYGATDPDKNFFLVDLIKGSISQIAVGSGSVGSPQWAPSGHFFAYAAGTRLEIWSADDKKLTSEVDLEEEESVWTWKNDSEIAFLNKGGLFLTSPEGKKQAIPFIAQETPEIPEALLYAQTERVLILVYSDRVLTLGL